MKLLIFIITQIVKLCIVQSLKIWIEVISLNFEAIEVLCFFLAGSDTSLCACVAMSLTGLLLINKAKHLLSFSNHPIDYKRY